MTSPSTASTYGDSWGQRLPFSPSADMKAAQLQPMSLGATIPPVWTATGLAADDLPRAKVLVVEDEAVVALDLQPCSVRQGFRVAGPAVTLGDVQRLIERGPIDCALLGVDVNRRTPLPVADLLAFADVPFVFVTSGGRSGVASEHSHRPVLEKPFGKADLVAALQRAMRKRTAAANDNRHVGPLGVDAWPRVFPSL